ncbi:MAG: hypothetical protein Q7V58_13525 [Actinomycetota bacterium]|nr:hypothetical protein [Actinomycetota bacterium]MDP1878914.1 hypothetical protein [Actinomycetota bacterium]
MKPFAKVVATMLGHGPLDREGTARQQIHREWDRQRALAISPSERAEIDAIFSRHL